MAALYHLTDVGKKFEADNLEIFHHINLTIDRGESVAIVGASGSGKSTLLHLMGALDSPSAGQVLFEGEDLASMNIERKAHFRNQSLGFVFQFHHLLPEFSAVENVAIPGLIGGKTFKDMLPRAKELMEMVGLAERMNSHPATLSGGERQRTAIARALLMEPKVILADEPTGNLDDKSGAQVAQLMLNLNRQLAMTLVVVTHNLELAKSMDRVLELKGGNLYEAF